MHPRALLKVPNHKLALLPAGEATIEKAGKVTLPSGKGEWTQYRITGLGFSPQALWLDRNGTAVSISGWFSVLPAGLESAIPQLRKAQEETDAAWSERIARALAHQPSGELVIRNAKEEAGFSGLRQSLLQLMPCNLKLSLGTFMFHPIQSRVLYENVQAMDKRPCRRIADGIVLGNGGDDFLPRDWYSFGHKPMTESDLLHDYGGN